MADIFLSYAREDEERIKILVSALEEEGWSVFWDRRIPAGKTWQNYIGQALEEARCMIVAWSLHSVDSDWVVEEANEAKRRGLLIPILLDPVEPPLGFRGIQAADLTDWKPGTSSAHFYQLAQDIAGLIGARRRRPRSEMESIPRRGPAPAPRPMDHEAPQREQAPPGPESEPVERRGPGAAEVEFPGSKKRRPVLKSRVIASVLAIAVLVAMGLFFKPRRPTAAKNPPVSGPDYPTARPDAGPAKKVPFRPVPGAPSEWLAKPDIVIDRSTRLMWTRGDFKTLTGSYAEDWRRAMRWAAEMNARRYAGYADWSLASLSEYETIKKPAWRDVFFSDNEDYYWARDGQNSYMDFNSASTTGGVRRPDFKTGSSRYSARLVRRFNDRDLTVR